MLILDLWGISFHAVVVFGLDKNLLFKYILGHCVKVPHRENVIPLHLGNEIFDYSFLINRRNCDSSFFSFCEGFELALR